MASDVVAAHADDADAPYVRHPAPHAKVTHDDVRGAGDPLDPLDFAPDPLIFDFLADEDGYRIATGQSVRIGGRGAAVVSRDIWIPIQEEEEEEEEPVAYLPTFDPNGVFVYFHRLRREVVGPGCWTPAAGDDVAVPVGRAYRDDDGLICRDFRAGSSVAYRELCERSPGLWMCRVHVRADGSWPRMGSGGYVVVNRQQDGMSNKRRRISAMPAERDDVGEFVAIRKMRRRDAGALRRISAMLSVLPGPDDDNDDDNDPNVHGRNRVQMIKDLFRISGDDDHVYVVTPWCHLGELPGQFVDGPTAQPASSSSGDNGPRYWFRQILDALHYLQSRELCHRNINPGNVLVDADRTCRVDGVGGASLRVPHVETTEGGRRVRRIIQAQERPTNDDGDGGAIDTSCMSPEVRDSRPFDGFAVDLYSAGVILYAMLTKGYPPSLPVERRHAGGLLYHMLQAQREQQQRRAGQGIRPTLAEVMRHSWVRGNGNGNGGGGGEGAMDVG